MRNQIWWVISILKEEKASNASFLYCGKKNPLVVSALHNALTNSSVVYNTHAIAA
jgi:hypothetical protein